MSKLLTKEVEVVDSGCFSNPFLGRQQWLIERAKEVAWLFSTAKELFQSFLRWLLYWVVGKAELIFFCFLFLYICRFLKAWLRLFRLVIIESYIYEVSQPLCPFTQIWQMICHLCVRKKENVSIFITIIIGQVLFFLILTPINLLALSMYLAVLISLSLLSNLWHFDNNVWLQKLMICGDMEIAILSKLYILKKMNIYLAT